MSRSQSEQDWKRARARMDPDECLHPLEWITESAQSGIVWCNACGHQFGLSPQAWKMADPLGERVLDEQGRRPTEYR